MRFKGHFNITYKKFQAPSVISLGAIADLVPDNDPENGDKISKI